MTGGIALAALLLAQAAPDAPESPRARVVRIEAPAAADPALTQRVEESAAGGALSAAAWLALELPRDAPLPLRWFESHEAMGVALGAADLLLDDPSRGPVAFTFGSGRAQPLALPDDAPVASLVARAGACAALRALVPNSASAMRTALAELVTDPDCAVECTRLAATLRSLGLLPTVDVLREPPRPVSPELARIAWISYLAAQPAAPRVASLDATDAQAAGAWSLALDSVAAAATTAAVPSPSPIRHILGSSPLRGFCFSHEGYRWLDGYGSRAAYRSLSHVATKLGATAVSLTPFAFQRNVTAPSITTLFDRAPTGPGASESDASIAITAADARSLGLTVVLKPHLWCGRGGRAGEFTHAWCGEIAMTNEADWQAWFAEYERLLVHYALLARRCGIPVLCVGTELQGTTRLPLGTAAWRKLLTKVRALHPGVITYCANWGDEVEKVPFWDLLDVIGVSAYWPLADAPGAKTGDLVRRFAEVLDRMHALGERHRRPVWFLEIGFADVHEPWIRPNEKAGEPDGGEDQGIAYRVVLQTSRDRGFPDALFWWKWPSDFDLPGRRGPLDRRRDFWPCGRPAEREITRAWAGAEAGETGER